MGCTISHTVFKEEYGQDQQEQSIRDVYSTLWVLSIDSIPMEDWTTFQEKQDEGFFVERVYVDKDPYKDWFFIYQTYYGQDATTYHFEIVEKTRNRLLLSPGGEKYIK